MGNPAGFIYSDREPPKKRSVGSRVKDYRELYKPWSESKIQEQAGRCMACGVPFCHTGCPLGNLIPDWNDLVYQGSWERALDALHKTNNFPEFTGRICPAPCESSCVLSINQDPVTIEYIEKEIGDRGFREGWIKPVIPKSRTGKKVAVVGSGPAGLAAAAQLNSVGHNVTVFERDEYNGGLLRLGIPDFKLEKHVVQRRVDLIREEGVCFETGVNIGVNYTVERLLGSFDAICLAGGATQPRDLMVPGRDLKGVHFAMEYLAQQNRILDGQEVLPSERINAMNKRVVILGGGDTGSDCLGTAHRQGAKEVIQFEILPEPPLLRRINNPWPEWPLVLRLSAAHEEGGSRDYAIATKKFTGAEGCVNKLHAVRVRWKEEQNKRMSMEEIEGSEIEIEADLVLLALGFLHPEQVGLLDKLGVVLDARGSVAVDNNMMTSLPGIFAAGDMVRGASLVVWAIAQGRDAARGIDEYLMGDTDLPRAVQ